MPAAAKSRCNSRVTELGAGCSQGLIFSGALNSGAGDFHFHIKFPPIAASSRYPLGSPRQFCNVCEGMRSMRRQGPSGASIQAEGPTRCALAMPSL